MNCGRSMKRRESSPRWSRWKRIRIFRKLSFSNIATRTASFSWLLHPWVTGRGQARWKIPCFGNRRASSEDASAGAAGLGSAARHGIAYYAENCGPGTREFQHLRPSRRRAEEINRIQTRQRLNSVVNTGIPGSFHAVVEPERETLLEPSAQEEQIRADLIAGRNVSWQPAHSQPRLGPGPMACIGKTAIRPAIGLR